MKLRGGGGKRRGREDARNAPALRSHFALALGSLLVAAAAAEVGLRACVPVAYRRPPQRDGEAGWENLVHRASEVPGLAYEPVPGMYAQVDGVGVRIDEHGLRDAGHPVEPPDPGFRIAALGDSFTFGFGVSGEQAWPNALERRLAAAHGARGCVFEVLNFGVGGYSSRDEALVFSHKALRFRPDLAIVAYVLNDPDIEPIQPLHAWYADAEWWQYAHLLRLLAASWRLADQQRRADGDYYRWVHRHPGKWASAERAFTDIGSAARAEGVAAWLAIFPEFPVAAWSRPHRYADLHAQVAAAARGAGLHVVDLQPAFAREDPSRLRQSRDDSHPTAFGHGLAARELAHSLAGSPGALTPRARARLERCLGGSEERPTL